VLCQIMLPLPVGLTANFSSITPLLGINLVFVSTNFLSFLFELGFTRNCFACRFSCLPHIKQEDLLAFDDSLSKTASSKEQKQHMRNLLLLAMGEKLRALAAQKTTNVITNVTGEQIDLHFFSFYFPSVQNCSAMHAYIFPCTRFISCKLYIYCLLFKIVNFFNTILFYLLIWNQSLQ
jgi:hypothetical protein